MIIYEALNHEVIKNLPDSINSILDVGCGDGSLGAYIKQKYNAEVTGITYSEQEAKIARTKIDKILVSDINTVDLNELGNFDCIICSHILEHLYDPQSFLKKLNHHLAEKGTLIIALPNILFWKQRLKFLNGSFAYTEGGLMDSTHFRFFDWNSSQALVQKGGFTVVHKYADGAFPLLFFRSVLGKCLSQGIDRFACRLYPGLFGFQFIFCCKVDK